MESRRTTDEWWVENQTEKGMNESGWKWFLTLSQHDCVDGCHVQRTERQSFDPSTTNTHCAGDKSFNHSTTEHHRRQECGKRWRGITRITITIFFYSPRVSEPARNFVYVKEGKKESQKQHFFISNKTVWQENCALIDWYQTGRNQRSCLTFQSSVKSDGGKH